MSFFRQLKKIAGIQISFVLFLQIAGVALGLLTFTGYLGRFWWALDLTSHFRVQYAAALLVAAFVLLVKRHWKWSVSFLIFCLINVSEFVGLYMGRPPFSESLVSPFRVMLLNVQTENTRYQEVISYIREIDPDLIVLEETNDRWDAELAVLKDEFPHELSKPREDNFGITLFSKHELMHREVMYFGAAGVPSVYVEFEIEGREVALLGTHPLPPGSRENSMLRNSHLEEAGKFLNEADKPIILLGDLNVTPWNHYFERLLGETGLENSARGFGVQMTWPTSFPFPMRIQIDHCLNSSDLHVSSFQVGKSLGSDHLPLIVDFALKDPSEQPR